MPQVPDIPGVVPQTQPFERPVPLPGVDVPKEGFTAVSTAMEHFGLQGQDAAEKVYNRALALKQLQVDNSIRDLSSNYFNEISPLQADFMSRDDVSPADLNAHNAKLEGIRQKYAGLAQQYGPYGQNQFGADSASMQRSFIREATLHSADRQRKTTILSIKSAADLDQDLSSKDPDNEEGFRSRIASSDANIAAATKLEFGVGSDSPITKSQQLIGRSRAGLRRIDGWLAKGDPDSAQRYIDTHQDDFTPADFGHAQLMVGARAHSLRSTAIVDDFFTKHVKQDGTMDMSNRDAQELIRQQARDQYPNLKELPEQAVRAFDQRIYTGRIAGRNDQISAATLFWNLMGQYKPETTEDYYKIPAENGHPSGQQVADILGKVDPKFSIEQQLTTFNLRKNIETEKRALVRLNGMYTQGTDGGLTEFLGIKDWAAYGIKNPDDIIKLQNIQLQKSRDPKSDPRVSSAISLAREYYEPRMHNLGVFKRDPKSKTKQADYDSFVGLLQEGLNKWDEDHGKAPSNKEIVNEILPDVLHTHAYTGYFGWTSREPVYHGYVKPAPEDVPKTFADDQYNEAIRRGGSPPTPMQIYNSFLRLQYNKIMELEKTKPGGQSVGSALPQSR